mmetsp:Transcript_12240/g.18771  ORF Transcript_12240/g.18771 Transcript_12240/m.18771 type:complete len:189 (-) Transcript_12240:157-723(-)
MSDLAPFVAAAINDKVVLGLMEELEEKTEALNSSLSRMIRITGPGGSPVYAQRDYFERVRDDEEDGPLWRLDMINYDSIPANPSLSKCDVEEIYNCELHIGTKEVIKFSSDMEKEIISHTHDDGKEVAFSLEIPSKGNNGYQVIIAFRGSQIEFDDSNYPNGFFPENYRNDQIDCVRFEWFEFYNEQF